MKKCKVVNLLIYVILLLVLSACQSKQESTIKPKDKAPESISKLSGGIDQLLGSVRDIEKIKMDIPLDDKEEEKKEQEKKESTDQSSKGQDDQDQAGGQGQDQGQGQGQGQGGDQANQVNKSSQEEKKSPEDIKNEEIKKKWDEIEKKLEEIHGNWNAFQVEGQKKGASKEAEDKFEAAFNRMTKAVEGENIPEIYDYASQALNNLKPLFDLYQEEIGGDVATIKYAAYQGYLRAIQGDKEAARKVLSDKEESINRIRLKLTKDEEKQKLDLVQMALVDFSNSLDENSKRLFMIKKDLIIKNIESLTK